VVVTNIGGAQADAALFALAPELYARFATSPRRGQHRRWHRRGGPTGDVLVAAAYGRI